ncbi:putative galacturonosyltransferase 6 [Nymphaea thermarum]|nr:putative galacturonosyltransferase 6 [Nymphaea thermarum]
MHWKHRLKRPRVIIVALLAVSVLAPVLFLSHRINYFSNLSVRKELAEEFSNIRFTTDSHRLNAIQQEGVNDVKEPKRLIYKDENNSSRFPDRGLSAHGSNHHDKDLRENLPAKTGKQNQTTWQPGARREQTPISRQPTDERVRLMKDQLIRAKAYMSFAPPTSNSHLVKELRLRIRQVERVVDTATKDSDLPRSAMKRMRAMDAALVKAAAVYHDCPSMATRLRAMAFNSEEQVRAHMKQTSHLIKLAAGTLSKGFHCLSMQLTTNYFTLHEHQQKLPNRQKLLQHDLYHFAVFSDNVLACGVVVNSTISTSMNPEKIVFHVVTDAMNYPAMMMWFLLNPPGKATIEVLNIDELKWLPTGAHTLLQQLEKDYSSSSISRNRNPKYVSPLNHLRFFLPELFPALHKIILLDHDVVVQRDLSRLWRLNMHGKVIGVVETCGDSESPRHLDTLLNFSDPLVASSFNSNTCLWAFGMNIFDLREWRRQNLTAVYHKWQELSKRRQLWKLGSLPVGLVTFYNLTTVLNHRWHVLGLGYDSSKSREEIERAAVIHYDGNMKPWLDIGIPKFKGYWSKFLNYDQPYLQQCNIHE